MTAYSPTRLAALHSAAFSEGRTWNADEIRGMLTSRLVFVVTTPYGFAMGRVVVDEAELLTIAVDPGWQGHGIGRDLLRRFEAEARNRGAVRAFLEVAQDNTAARALYNSAGWSESGRRARYYARPTGRNVDAIMMHKWFTQGEASGN
ncbi:ribosomal protein S18-alanine N-acetyltransferase [uncultured Aliiroseovarius sp.]|uniref:ribosomal protein S18-alanine N-acetyltransferase n=1 Tax=uncultured Aliiroseovarius sp. TaxID=1658783 RepID=UPI002593965B|nr:ribosomal protein S18-alanine N-acetyltransferase [uncultured Aliiroseovarius sp.]